MSKKQEQEAAANAESRRATIAGQIRHVLTGLAGAAIASAASRHGVDDSTAATVAQIGSGAVLYGIGAVWSWFAKRRANRAAASAAKPRKPRPSEVAARTGADGASPKRGPGRPPKPRPAGPPGLPGHATPVEPSLPLASAPPSPSSE